LVKNSIISQTDEEEEEDVGEKVDLVEILRTDLLVSSCQKLQEDVNILNTVAAIFQFSGDLNKFPDFVQNELAKPGLYLPRFKYLSGKKHAAKVFAWIEVMVTTYQQFQKDLVELIQFDGDLAGLPAFTLEFIRNLRMKHQEESAELQRQVSASREELVRHRAKSDSTIESLTAQIEVLEQKNPELTESLEVSSETLAAHGTEAQQTIASLAKSCSQLEVEMAALKTDNGKLKEQLGQRMRRENSRATKLFEEERRQHAAELERIVAKTSETIEKFKASLNKKSQRNRRLKEKTKEIVASYEAALARQKEVMTLLRHEHDEVVSAEEAMNAQITQLRIENAELQAKVDGFGEKLLPTEDARDVFWRSKISLIEHKAAARERLAVERASKPALKVDAKSLGQLNEWESWARNSYLRLNDGVCCHQSSRDLRAVLNERILGSVENSESHGKIESLRLQKRLLVAGKTSQKADRRIAIRPLIIVGMALHRMRKAIPAHALE
jgi:DNA repair exonuclease SbcCD ATPase subunit